MENGKGTTVKEKPMREQFKFNILPLKTNRWLVRIIILLIPVVGTIVFLPILGKFYFRSEFSLTYRSVVTILVISLFLAIFCVMDGIFAGWWYKKTGKFLTNFGFLRPLESMIDNDEQGLSTYINNFIFGKGENFLLFNAIDRDHSTMRKMFRSNLRPIQMLAAMFIVVLNFFLQWSPLQTLVTEIGKFGTSQLSRYISTTVDLQIPLETFILFYLTLSVALTILAIVLPLLLITDHTYVYQYTKDKEIKQAGSKPRNAINDTFSIFTIISGFNLIRNDIEVVENQNILIDLIVFVVLLSLILIYGLPITFAALNTYYDDHEDIVNELRDTLRRAGYPILLSQATPISEDIMEELEVHNTLTIPDYQEIERDKILNLARLVEVSQGLRDLPSIIDDENTRGILYDTIESGATDLGYSKVETVHIPSTDTQALLTKRDNTVYIAFPGTKGRKDILTDLKVGGMQLSCGNWITRKFDNTDLQVHKGANRAICSCIGDIRQYLKTEAPTEVVITGHSLGGMLATLLAGYLVKEPGTFEIELYTFGNPAVGNLDFVDFINFNVKSTLFVANQNDPVPNLLPEFLDYHHIANKVILDNTGEFSNDIDDVIFPSETKRAVRRIIQSKSIPNQHFMEEYIRRLER